MTTLATNPHHQALDSNISLLHFFKLNVGSLLNKN